MPARRLPNKLVSRLRTVVKNAEKRGHDIPRFLGKMPNVDRRMEYDRKKMWIFPFDKPEEFARAEIQGSRVRQLNISRNYPKKASGKPGVELVIKHAHTDNAKITLDTVGRKVREFNKEVKNPGFFFVAPKAYVVGKRLIAMSKTEAPTIEELIVSSDPRAIKIVNDLSGKLNISPKKLILTIHNAAEMIGDYTNISRGDIFVMGVKNGKLVYMAAPDTPM
jgi:hypothetical protein